MNKFTHKLLLAFLFVFSVFAVASCDGQKTTTAGTTAVETTVVSITTQGGTSTITTTTYPASTTAQTTTGLVTTETTTVPPTTTQTTTLPATTTTAPTTVTTTTFVDQSELVVEGLSTTTYTIGDVIDLSTLTVTFYDQAGTPTVLRDMDYTVSPIDTSTYGQKQLVITYGEYQAVIQIQVNLPAYYMDAMDLTGNTLFLELRTIINTGFSGVTYGDARYILDETDADPNHAGNLILLYLGTSVSGVWDSGVTWNREHVWPQSGMPVSASNSVVNMASDLQNLKPSDPVENSTRGNDYFDNVAGTYAYVPRDEVKGDIARILLYMIVKYDQLSLVDGTPNLSNYEMGIFSVLLQWNHQDPVDDFERNRNDVIYGYQHNRNPFIDYPDFADLIWS